MVTATGTGKATGVPAEPDGMMRLSLLGGPLHRLGTRLGFVRAHDDTVGLGLTLGVGAWVVLIVLAVIQGYGRAIFTLEMLSGHVRLLVVIPLAFLCESWVAPRMQTFADTIVRSGVVSETQLGLEIARVRRWADSWLPDTACLVGCLLLSFWGSSVPLAGNASAFDPRGHEATPSLAGLWFWYVCLPVFRLVMLRWIWRLVAWAWFLMRVAGLELKLVPTHPDGAGGLGYLDVTQMHFLPLVLAISALLASGLAGDIASGRIPFEALYPGILLVLLLNLVLFVAPAFAFTPKLWAARVKGQSDYMIFAAKYVGGFDRKWLGKGAAPEPLLGTPDLQSLADLGNSISLVTNMRLVPVTLRLLEYIGIAALLPVVPLVLMKYPMTQLLQAFFERVLGL